MGAFVRLSVASLALFVCLFLCLSVFSFCSPPGFRNLLSLFLTILSSALETAKTRLEDEVRAAKDREEMAREAFQQLGKMMEQLRAQINTQQQQQAAGNGSAAAPTAATGSDRR